MIVPGRFCLKRDTIVHSINCVASTFSLISSSLFMQSKLQVRLCILAVLTTLPLYYSGCSSIHSRVRGEVKQIHRGDMAAIEYDLHFNPVGVDSVTIQLLPPGKSNEVNYPVERKVKDSLYRAFADSCCQDLSALRYHLQDSLWYKLANSLDGKVCWWSRKSFWKDNSPFSPVFDYEWWGVVDSILAHTSPDSLRAISVPCGWLGGLPDIGIDTALQHDSVIYRKSASNDLAEGDRAQETGSKHGRLTGSLQYRWKYDNDPTKFCLKFFESRNEPSKSPQPTLEFHADPLAVIWKNVVPTRPPMEIYDLEDPGNCLGMYMGFGATESDLSRLPSRLASDDSRWLGNLEAGLSYYTARTVIDLGGGFAGYSGREAGDNAYQFGYGLVPGIRWYPLTRSSRGALIKTALVSNTFKVREGSGSCDRGEWGVQAGLGYETGFDRIEYSYVSALDGYHELDILVGLNAIRHGKEGLRLLLRHGSTVRFASIQFYMGNRVLWETISPHNRRSRLATVLLFAGATALWTAIY